MKIQVNELRIGKYFLHLIATAFRKYDFNFTHESNTTFDLSANYVLQIYYLFSSLIHILIMLLEFLEITSSIFCKPNKYERVAATIRHKLRRCIYHIYSTMKCQEKRIKCFYVS